MASKVETETEQLARHLDGDDKYSSEEGAEALLSALGQRGGSLVVFESSYWGKETFGPDGWTEVFFADVAVETDDALKFGSAVDASYILGALAKKNNAETELAKDDAESDFESLGDDYWKSQIREAEHHLTEFDPRASDMLGSGWAPKSKVVFKADRKGPAEYVLFENGENTEVEGHAEDAETVITGTTTVRGNHRRYNKLAIDIPYDEDFNPKEDIDELTWDDYKFTAKYENDNFQCWTADKEPREVASILSEYYDGCAVQEDLLEIYDG